MKDCQDNQIQSALNIPYFEGDFWSNIIEESIKGKNIEEEMNNFNRIFVELDQEEEDRRKQEMEAARAIDDGGLDDPIEPEDPTDVNSFSHSIFLSISFSRRPINVNQRIHTRRKI